MSKYSIEMENLVSKYLRPKIQTASLQVVLLEETSVESQDLQSALGELEYLTALYDFITEYVEGDENLDLKDVTDLADLVGVNMSGISGVGVSENLLKGRPSYSEQTPDVQGIGNDVSIINGDIGELNEKTGEVLEESFYHTMISFASKKNTSAISIGLFCFEDVELQLSLVNDSDFEEISTTTFTLEANTPLQYLFTIETIPLSTRMSIRYRCTKDVYCTQINIITG